MAGNPNQNSDESSNVPQTPVEQPSVIPPEVDSLGLDMGTQMITESFDERNLHVKSSRDE